MARFNGWYNNKTKLTITASIFDSKWDASGQIPERAVESGLITRFGAIDNTEGGNTSRTNISARLATKLKKNWELTNQLYYVRYGFNLFSNFTFFLEDPINGDQIRQKESRNILGSTNTLSKEWAIGKSTAITTLGAGVRYDDINDLELSRSIKRQYLSTIQKGSVDETNTYLYLDQHINLNPQIILNAGVRYDHFQFGYKDDNGPHRRLTAGIVSPKLNLTYNASPGISIFLNNSIGFHSNDARVSLDPDAENILPRVFGNDLGLTFKPVKHLLVKFTMWHLYSEQEFVYVGDAGIVEPSGKSRRIGVDLSARYQFASWLYADLDMNLTRARAIGEPKGEDHIPLAPSFTSIGGLTAKLKNGLDASLRYRFIDDRSANEFNSVVAPGYFLTDLVANYSFKNFEFFVSFENIFNVEWNEAQFDTESRLNFEPQSFSEIHFTPGTPRFLKGGISWRF
jgi:outer membrane receptor protein involved in Fe transport